MKRIRPHTRLIKPSFSISLLHAHIHGHQGERVVFNTTHSICRGHTAIFRRWGGRMFARLVVGDEDMLPLSFTPSSTNSSEEKDLNGTITALGLKLKGGQKPPDWDPRRLQLTEEVREGGDPQPAEPSPWE